MRPPFLCLLFPSVALAVTTARPVAVKLDEATIIGTSDGVVTQFLGIPFAEPPVGNLRLELPQPIRRYKGIIDATTFGNQCIQQAVATPTLPDGLPPEITPFVAAMTVPPNVTQSEDCEPFADDLPIITSVNELSGLNINVVVPAKTKPGAKLPIAAWIYGGGFQVGSNTVRPGGVIVNRSIELGQPIIFVSMNYRLSAFGMLGGREIANAGLGNLGLQDQREALRWLQKHISTFGGDPAKVTIWGESAGSTSVAYQMLANGGDTEGLFRGAWMESHAVNPVGNVSKIQPNFDFIASQARCASAIDIIQCLREAPVGVLKAAMDKTPNYLSSSALNTPWMPHADGLFLSDNPQRLVLDGKIADIPFVIGSNEDEGTLFSLAALNVTTEEEFVAHVKSTYFPEASVANISRLLEFYPANPAFGSPFGTGRAFAFSPQYKRLAAFQGDLYFVAARRFLLQQQAKRKRVVRSFLSERNKITGLGATHTTELANIFGGGDMTDFFVRFVNTLNPNGGTGIHWPMYTSDSPQLLTFVEGKTRLKVIPDTFREESNQFLTQLGLEQPV
ncbi:carotenoid ester lipase precursor [Trametes maxima]|nr:carotenoid ester lipase precursor [Trametes maxima]